MTFEEFYEYSTGKGWHVACINSYVMDGVSYLPCSIIHSGSRNGLVYASDSLPELFDSLVSYAESLRIK
ncbi:MAG: hypothetical protein GY861_21530 [bacterium]|nr:hypothetical protein [bacterium]